MMRTLVLPLSPTLARPPRVRGPGLTWLPTVLRQRATWRTVGRFGLWGPLLGSAPYAVFLAPIPFAYVIGTLPALLAGLLFAAWYHGSAGRPPTWPWRGVLGALCGAAPAAVLALFQAVWAPRASWFMTGIIAAHGVPAAVILALLQAPAPEPVRGRDQPVDSQLPAAQPMPSIVPT